MKVIDNYPSYPLDTMAVITSSSHRGTRGQVSFNQRWHTAKIALRAWILASIALTWCLFAVTHNTWGIIAVPVMIPDIIWQLVEFVVLAKFRKTKKRGIHPIAHLVWDLLYWMAYFVIAVMFSGLVIPAGYYDSSAGGHDIQSELNLCAFFLFIVWLLHFVLFIRDCMEVHQRRKSKAAFEVVYYVPGHGDASSHAKTQSPTTSSNSSFREVSCESVEPKVVI